MSLSREHFEELTKRSPDIIVGTDRKGRVVYFNDGAHDSLGYENEEVLGEFVGLLYPSVVEARRVADAMRGPEHGGSGVCNTLETKFVSRSGEEIPVAISATLLYDEAGEEDGTIVIA
jgi:PAS domain S-box-containing protein